MNPTNELYSLLTDWYDIYNARLFEKQLPAIIFTTQRQLKTMGYFSPNRWVNTNNVGSHEISINPSYIGQNNIIETLKNLVKQMISCWQQCYGKPGKNGYHNEEWSKKAREVGLVPTSTGKSGGNKIGYKIDVYPAPDGEFLKVCADIINRREYLATLWLDTESLKHDNIIETPETDEDIELNQQIIDSLYEMLDEPNNEVTEPIAKVNNVKLQEKTKNLNMKTKYTCKTCDFSVWGAKERNLQCLDCGQKMSMISPIELPAKNVDN